MKLLLLLVMACPFVALATPSGGVSLFYYHGESKEFPVNGGHSSAVVSMTERLIHAYSSYFIYRRLTNETDRSYILLIKIDPNVVPRCVPNYNTEAGCTLREPTFGKVYVPSPNQSLTNIDEHNVTSLQMQEAGWVHSHFDYTPDGYISNYFFNFDYPGLGRVNANIILKMHTNGKWSKSSNYVVSNEDGLQYVWADKMKLVLTAP